MADWITRKISDVVQDVEDNSYVLPVIQRRLVWDEEKMETLFDSLMKENAFGGVMVLYELRYRKPLFAFRPFSRHGEPTSALLLEQLERNTYLVIDGQQRLQTLYMGLRTGYNGQVLYFDLLSSSQDYDFRFAAGPADLPVSEKTDGGQPVIKLWYPAAELYFHLQPTDRNGAKEIARAIAENRGVTEASQVQRIEDNVNQFYYVIFESLALGVSQVKINSNQPDAERLRIVELFRRLNDGGTRLSSYDLAASRFKGFDYRMEKFFEVLDQFTDMQIYQDEAIRLIFLLQDYHGRDILDVKQEDANFAVQNQERIVQALNGTRRFLRYAGLSNYFNASGRSVIPLYFITYHIFHQPKPTDDLPYLYENYDTGNRDFGRIKRWVCLSLLNRVFSRGSGWVPYQTGIRKILQVMREHKGQFFPVETLFDIYAKHPLHFNESLDIRQLAAWDEDFTLYLVYNGEVTSGKDKDHIHPYSRLSAEGVPASRMNYVANYQLLDSGTNRHEKRAKTLADWIRVGVEEESREDYLRRHLIPRDETLWQTSRFDRFLEQREAAILDRVRAAIPEIGPASPAVAATSSVVSALSQTEEDTRELLTPDQPLPLELPAGSAIHPILDDITRWYDIYKARGVGRRWYGSYRRELAHLGLHTVADLARAIMVMGLEQVQDVGYGVIYRFHRSPVDGRPVELDTSKFGAWGWKVALDELDRRNFPWREYLLEP